MRRRAHVLTSPVFLSALLVLVLNDHVFKTAWPSAITGKLSDFAGVAMVAIALSVLAGRRVAVATTAVAFTALKAVPGVNHLAAPALGGVTLTDRTDLIALTTLGPVYWWLSRAETSDTPRQGVRTSPALVVPAFAAAVLATTATSAPVPEGVVRLAHDGETLYAGIGVDYGSERDPVDMWAASDDRGRSWSAVTAPPPPGATMSADEACNDEGTCWSVRADTHLARCEPGRACQPIYSVDDIPLDRPGGVADEQFQSVIVVPGPDGTDVVVVTLGTNGIAISQDGTSFDQQAVLKFGHRPPPTWIPWAAMLALATVGAMLTARVAKLNDNSPHGPLLICLLGAGGVFVINLATAILLAIPWQAPSLLCLFFFLLAYLVARWPTPKVDPDDPPHVAPGSVAG